MGIYLRQICLVAHQLDPVIAALKDVFCLNTAYIDDEVAHFGLENTLLGIGTQCLEVVAPVQANTAAGRYLDRLGGDGGYMVIGQVLSQAEQDACRARAAENDVRVAFERAQSDWRLMQLHPRDMQAAFFEIDWEAPCDPKGHWSPAGGTAWLEQVNRNHVQAIKGVTLESRDPLALAGLWSRIAGAPLELAGEIATVALEDAVLRFVANTDIPHPRLTGVSLQASDPIGIRHRAAARGLDHAETAVRIGGVWFDFKG